MPLMQRRVEAGASSPAEVTRVQAAVGFTRLERERSRTALAVARRELSVLMGLRPARLHGGHRRLRPLRAARALRQPS